MHCITLTSYNHLHLTMDGGSAPKRHTANQSLTYISPFPSLKQDIPSPLLSYLQTIFSSSSPFTGHVLLSEPIQATYDTQSGLIWVTRAQDVLACWQKGFYGKGNLSRSEPSWWVREQNRRGGNLRESPVYERRSKSHPSVQH